MIGTVGLVVVAQREEVNDGDDGDGDGGGGDGGSGGHGDNDDDEENYFLKDEIEGKTNACHSITPTSTLERLYEVVLELIFEESF